MHSHTRKRLPAWIFILLILIVLSAAFFIYFGDYYHADAAYLDAMEYSDITITDTDFGWFIDGPSTDKALIFYPGAKVEAAAYEPFLSLLSSEGIDVFLIKMPFNFAIFGLNSANRVISEYSYDFWYIGGHSLGGAMAASYASSHPDLLDGVILCAAYPTKQIDDSMSEIVIYGSEDLVLNMDKVMDGREYAPRDYIEYVINGGNHAQFGNYGIQEGDGTASISSEEQQEIAADVIIHGIG